MDQIDIIERLETKLKYDVNEGNQIFNMMVSTSSNGVRE